MLKVQYANQPTLVVVDDFYSDPDLVRREALNSQYVKSDVIPYPGLISSSYSEHRLTAIAAIVESVKEIFLFDRDCDKYLGGFRMLRQGEASRRFIHQHNRKWSALIYLNPADQCSGGTTFYKHKDFGEGNAAAYFKGASTANRDDSMLGLPGKADPKILGEDPWTELFTIPMRYNRLIVFDARMFHSGSPGFGDNPSNARVTQNFDFGPWISGPGL